MSLRILQIDSFTDTPFAGNPAAVLLLPDARADAWMQAVAREMNLSETAFLRRRPDGAFDLRWFTPTDEVDLCGHATLAAAHALWEEGHLAADADARFHTRSGLLTARRTDEAGAPWITMDFPAEPATEVDAPAALDALGAPLRYVGRNRMDYVVLLDDEATVRALRPDLSRLATIDARGIIATAAADRGAPYDFVSRFFGPRVGVPEDPVTGSAHCCLAPLWQARLGRDVLTGYQASARGGTVRVRPHGGRVALAGQAVTVLHAALLV